MKKLFAFILALLLIIGGSAFSESCPSPDTKSIVKVESEYFSLSNLPNDLMPVEIIRVDLNGSFYDSSFVLAMFTPTYIPGHIHSVILTDGTYVAQAAFEIQGDALLLYFYVPDLMQFISTTGLWLILIEQVT